MTPEAELELRARGLQGETLVRVSYQRPERVDEKEHAVLHCVFLELASGARFAIGTDDAFRAHHGSGVSIADKKRPFDRAFGEVVDVSDTPAWKAHIGQEITRALVRWSDVRENLRASLSIGVSIHADYLRRRDYPAALEIDTSAGRVAFHAARRGPKIGNEDGVVIPFVNALLVSF